MITKERKNTMVIGDSELKVMKILWEQGNMPIEAKQVSGIAGELYGWNKNTTYTLLKRCVEKGTIKREDPNFVCTPLITKEEVQREEMEHLIEKIFDNSNMSLFTVLMEKEGISSDKIEVLIQLVEKLKS